MQSLKGISLIQYIIPILEGGLLEAGLSCHVTWILKHFYGISLIQYIIPILEAEGGWLGAGLGSHVTWIRRSIS